MGYRTGSDALPANVVFVQLCLKVDEKSGRKKKTN